MQTEGFMNSLTKIARAALAIFISITLVVSLTPLPAHAANGDDSNPAIPDQYQTDYNILGNIGSSAILLDPKLGHNPTQKYLIYSNANKAEYPLPDNSPSGTSYAYAVVGAIDGGSATYGTNDPCVYQQASGTTIKVYNITGKEIGTITATAELKLPQLQQTALPSAYVLIQHGSALAAYNNKLQALTTNPSQATAYSALSQAPVIQGQQSYLIPAGFNSEQESAGAYYVNSNFQIFSIAGYELFSHPSTYSGANGTAAAVAYRADGSQVYFVQGPYGNWGIIDGYGNQLATFSFSDYFLNQSQTGKNPTGYILVDGQWYESTIEQMIADFAPYVPPAPPAVGSIQTVGNLRYKITAQSNGWYGRAKVMGPAISKNSIKKVYVPSTITINGYPYKVTAIASKAFMKCNRLEKVVIKSNIEEIGFAAFYKCKRLRSVAIASTLKVIHSKAFMRCYRLKYIKINSRHLTYHRVGKYAFWGVDKYARVRVPGSKVNYYANVFTYRGLPDTAIVKR